jgi:YidC/Oxa1 family membrane protein insertase
MLSKNFLLFIALSILVIVGWVLLQQQFAPPKPDKNQASNKDASKKKEDKAKKGKPKKDDKTGDKKAEKEPPKRPAPKAGQEKKPVDRQQTIALGADPSTYHIRAVLTTWGGGVRSVTFAHFQKADEDGKPVYDKDGNPVPLELVPDDRFYPSNLLYHYAEPDAPRPLNTLGRVNWEPVRRTGKGDWVRQGEGEVETDKDGVQRVTFQAEVPGFKKLFIRKTYTLAPKQYHLGLAVEIEDKLSSEGGDEKGRKFRYQLAGAHGLPIEGQYYTYTYRNAMVGKLDPKGNLARVIEDSRRISIQAGGDAVPENKELGDDRIQYGAVATQFFAAVTVVDNGADKTQPPQIIQWARPTLESTEMKGKVIGKASDRVLLVDEKGKVYDFAVAPDCEVDLGPTLNRFEDVTEDQLVKQVVNVTFRPGAEHLRALAIRTARIVHKPFLDDITVRLNSQVIQLKPGKPTAHDFLLYYGPVKVRLLSQFTGAKRVNPELVAKYESDLHLNTLTDYHSDNWFGRVSYTIGWNFLLIKCTNLMHGLLGFLYSIVPVYGLCIILLTVIVRGLMFPISRKQAMLSMRMQELAPELRKVQEKYKNDPQERTRAVMELYRRHGVNPLAGCLPLLLQMPIFLGLYYCLQESIHFRLASFLWIDNLAAPDQLFYWGQGLYPFTDPNNFGSLFSILYLGPFFNILPVIAVTLMLVQQKMMAVPPTDDNQAMQQKMFKYMMIFMGFIFYKVASGLCLYFIASSLWGVAERKLLPKKKGQAPAKPAAAGGPAKGPGKPGPRAKKGAPPKKDSDGAFQKVRNWWAEVLKQAKKK